MSKKNLYLSITNGLWLIDFQSAEQLGQNLSAFLNGEKFWDSVEQTPAEFLVVNQNDSFYSADLSQAKPGSIAVLNISGPMMKEDNCGDPGTKTYQQMLSAAAGNPNVIGVVLNIDSPGGTVAGTQILANQVKAFPKPIVTVAEDLMASAAYWVGSSANHIFANTGTTRVGSIGTMLSFADMQPVWEKEGVKFHEIYATASTEKNADFAEARKGNYDKIKASTLDPLNNEFLNAIKTNRGAKLNHDKTLAGQVYAAADALNYGLIDGIGTLNDAIEKVKELAGTPAQHTQTNTTNMKIKLLAAHAALLALFGITMAEGQQSTEVELTADNLDKLNAALEAGQTAAADLATEKEQHAAVKTELDELKKKNPGASGTERNKPDAEIENDFISEMDERLKADLAAAGF